jgi:hypothetical protein
MSERIRTSANTPLTPKQEQAAVLLARGMRPSRVVEELEVARTTLFEWRRLPAFEARLNEELEEAQEALRSKIRSIQLKALDVVEEALDSAEADLRERLAAARIAARLCPLPDPRSPGATDPGQIAEQRAQAEARREDEDQLAKLPAEERRAELRRRHDEEAADLLASFGG